MEKLRGEKQGHNQNISEPIKKDETKKEDADSLAAALIYRDRALERRKKYGSFEPPSPPSEYSAKLKMAKEKYEEESVALISASYSESENIFLD